MLKTIFLKFLKTFKAKKGYDFSRTFRQQNPETIYFQKKKNDISEEPLNH